MQRSPSELAPGTEINLLLPYVTDLEFEVDRLRKQVRFVEDQARESLARIRARCRQATATSDSAALSEIDTTARVCAEMLADLHEQPGFHPAHDQVVPIAIRPLVEQVFRWQQRLEDAPQAVLRLELEAEYLDWFPARLRHIIDNLLGNAVKYHTADKGETRVNFALRRVADGYELRVSDNGVGIPSDARVNVMDLFYRAAPARAAGLGVGLAVARLLVEQSGGTLFVESLAGQGTSFVVVLPRFDLNDFLDSPPG